MFSVVIPTYNRKKFIGRAIQSVLKQTFSDFEIVVADDCSTDNTQDLIVMLSMSDCRIHYYMQNEKKGAQSARNRGIREANGKWIAFLDSDDTWMPDHLENIFDVLKLHGFDEHIMIYSDYEEYKVEINQKHVIYLPDKSSYADLLQSPAPAFPGIVTSKLALEQRSLLDENVPAYQEWDTALGLAKYCRLVHIRKPLFVYYLHDGETISKDHTKDINGYQYILDKYKEDIINICGVPVWCEHVYRQYQCCVKFGFYDQVEKYRLILISEIRNALQELEKFAHAQSVLYCYGAGYVGKLLATLLKDWGINLQGYLISDGEMNLSNINGNVVQHISDVQLVGDFGVFIATYEKTHSSIQVNLKGYKNIAIYPIMDHMIRLMEIYVKVKGDTTHD